MEYGDSRELEFIGKSVGEIISDLVEQVDRLDRKADSGEVGPLRCWCCGRLSCIQFGLGEDEDGYEEEEADDSLSEGRC